jgi:hypothetical protein
MHILIRLNVIMSCVNILMHYLLIWNYWRWHRRNVETNTGPWNLFELNGIFIIFNNDVIKNIPVFSPFHTASWSTHSSLFVSPFYSKLWIHATDTKTRSCQCDDTCSRSCSTPSGTEIQERYWRNETWPTQLCVYRRTGLHQGYRRHISFVLTYITIACQLPHRTRGFGHAS